MKRPGGSCLFSKRLFWGWTTLAVMALIWWFSAADGTISSSQSSWLASLLFFLPRPTATFVIRKTAHFTIYLCLGLCAFQFFQTCGLSRKQAFWSALALAAVYASTDELHQRFVDGRSGQISDVLLDTCGALTGLLLRTKIPWRSLRPHH